jgi:peptide/nickel transport system substrate-binding protein
VRQALSHAIDKNQIIKTLLSGYGIPAVGPLTPMAWAFDESVKDIDFDRERAKTLLAQEGWRDDDNDGFVEKNGDPLDISIMVNSGSQLRQDVAILVQSQLENIGVKATIQRAEWNLFIEKVFQNAEFDAVILAWDTDFTVNPTDLWHSDAIDNGYNFVAYENPRIDHLLELGRNATDRAAAQPYWSEFQQIIINDCPYTFLFIQDNIIAYNERLHGCEFDLRSLYVNIDEWYVK